ncbi:MAG: DMT family transporter [Gammaproteobacteria bacterium]
MSSNRTSAYLPVAALLVGATMWGVIWYPMRLLETHGLAGIWLTFILYTAALIVSLPWAAGTLREFASEWRTLVPLALAGGWANTAFVLAILDGNVMRVLLLFYLAPMWAVPLGWILIGERVSRFALVTLVVALSGAGLLLWEPKQGIPWPSGHADWLALSSGFTFALSNALVRKSVRASITAKAVSVWVGVALVSFVLIALYAVPVPNVGASVVAGAVALGVGGILLMTVLVQYGVTHMPVYRSAIILLFELVAGAISQQLLTEEVMTPTDWFGGILIVAAAVVSARTERA